MQIDVAKTSLPRNEKSTPLNEIASAGGVTGSAMIDKTRPSSLEKFDFTLFVQNVRSMNDPLKCSIIEDIINEEKHKIICITEHWLKDEILECNLLQNFKLASCYCRKQFKGGGTAIFVRNSISTEECKFISEISIDKHFEVSATNLKGSTTDLIIMCIYRSPSGDFNVFLEKLEEIYRKLDVQQKYIIVGDFNVDVSEEYKQKTTSSMLLKQSI